MSSSGKSTRSLPGQDRLLRNPLFRRCARDWLGAKLQAMSCKPSDRFWCLFGMMDQDSEMRLLIKEERNALTSDRANSRAERA
jgi:hypothetical protein